MKIKCINERIVTVNLYFNNILNNCQKIIIVYIFDGNKLKVVCFTFITIQTVSVAAKEYLITLYSFLSNCYFVRTYGFLWTYLSHIISS